MRVIVTGGAGFVGRAVLGALQAEHDVVATDRALPAGVAGMEGDLSSPAFVEQLLSGGCDAIIHLATIPGGTAEAEPDLAWRANVEAVRLLAGAVAATCPGARFVYASSIAVFGDPMPSLVDDRSPVAPRLLYGAHKAIAELWLATLSRRGSLDAISLRLPGIVARPPDGAGLKSAFLSDVFHAIVRKQAYRVPVSENATTWLMSAGQAARNLSHGLLVSGFPDGRALTMPALRVRMSDLVAAIGRVAGRTPDITYAPDAALEAAFGRLPPLATPAADALGFAHDGDLDRLVTQAFGDAS